MHPAKNPFKTTTLNPAPGTEDTVVPLEVFNDGKVSMSAWQPTPEEVQKLANGAQVWLWVWGGKSSPPVFLAAATAAEIGDLTQGSLPEQRSPVHPPPPVDTKQVTDLVCPVCEYGVDVPPNFAFDATAQRYQCVQNCKGCTAELVVFVISLNRFGVEVSK